MVKKKAKAPKRKFAAKKVEPKVPNQGFFQRFKDILPEQKKETVRVKTFIVEKPVYVQAPAQRITAPPQKYQAEPERVSRFDARRSKYAKRKEAPVDAFTEEEAPLEEEQPTDELDAQDAEGTDDDASLDETSEEGLTDEEGMDAQADMEEAPVAPTHVRSRGMFKNVWWKKALFWAILVWLLILAISMAMQALKLVQVDLTRQWWILLAGIIVISMIYQKVFAGKIKI